ncbi:hypothetical protein BX600DRAFT_446828 [Xylariales sp. PMI_506]|nr:hypothetical protein BX600DRAFT_446828 [Xylariales sp. PMI_506]
MATAYSKMKVAELKTELKRLGLPQNGLKAELIARLEEASVATNAGTDAGTDASTQDDGDTIPVEDGEKAAEALDTADPEGIANLGEKNNDLSEVPTTAEHPPQPEESIALDAQLGRSSSASMNATAAEVVSFTATTDFAAPEIHERDSLSGTATASNGTPLPPAEVAQDNLKRKRRSVSPPPTADEIAQKRARIEDHERAESTGETEETHKLEQSPAQQAAETESVGVAHTDIGIADNEVNGSAQSITEPEELKTNNEINGEKSQDPGLTDVNMQDDDKQSTANDITRMESVDGNNARTGSTELNVEPSIHPATSAIYIKNFMRPLRPQAVQAHLLELAGANVGEEGIVDFYLDPIRTHSFVVFNSVSAASRVRTSLHNRVWPDETNRKALWVDFIPPEKFGAWVDMEQSSEGGGRGSSGRYEIIYDHDRDGTVMAHLEEVGSAPPATKAAPTQADRRPSVSGPPRGVEGAPLAPRGFQSGSRSQVYPSRADRIGGDYKTTRAHPTVPYQPVPNDLVDRRLDSIRAAKSKHYDHARDTNKEYKRYFFENGDVLVDRGPEIFLGIRPPHRERERERRRDRDRRPRGRPGGRRGFGMPMPHGVPKGGDRYRGAAAGDDGSRPQYRDDRGGDRYRGEGFHRH